MNSLVHYDLKDKIAIITMDDGKANVMSTRMLRELNAALDRAQADKAVVVLTGRDRMFSGGFDLAVFKRDTEELIQMLEAGAVLTERLLSFPFPVVAACTGHAVAMGAFLLLCADVRICVADQDVRIQVNEVLIGLTVPRFALEVCRQRLSPSHLHHAVMTAEPYSPQDALVAGFIDVIASPESLVETALSRAASLQTLDAESFAATKLRLRRNDLAALKEAIREDIADWKTVFRG